MIKKYVLFAVLCVHTVAPQLKAVTAEQYAAGGTIAALAAALTAGTTWGLKRRARLRKVNRLRRAMIARAVRRGDKAPDTRSITLAPSTIERMAPYILALALVGAGVGGASTAVLHKRKRAALPPRDDDRSSVAGDSRRNEIPHYHPPQPPVLALPLHGDLVDGAQYRIDNQVYTVQNLGDGGVWLQPQAGGELINLADARAMQRALNPVHHGSIGQQEALPIREWRDLVTLQPGALIALKGQLYTAIGGEDGQIRKFVNDYEDSSLSPGDVWQRFAPGRSVDGIRPLAHINHVQEDDFIFFGQPGQSQDVCQVVNIAGNQCLYPVQGSAQKVPLLLSAARQHAMNQGWVENPAAHGEGAGRPAPSVAPPAPAVQELPERGNFVQKGAQYRFQGKTWQVIDPGALMLQEVDGEGLISLADAYQQRDTARARVPAVEPAAPPSAPVPSHVRELEVGMYLRTAGEIKQLQPGHLIILTIMAPRHPSTRAREGYDKWYGYVVGEETADGFHTLTPIEHQQQIFASTKALINYVADDENRAQAQLRGEAGPGRVGPTAIRTNNDLRIALPGTFQAVRLDNGGVMQGSIKFDGETARFIKEGGSEYGPLTPAFLSQIAVNPLEQTAVTNVVEYLRPRTAWLKKQNAGIVLDIDGAEHYFLPSLKIKNRSGEQMLFGKNDAGVLVSQALLRSVVGKSATVLRVIKSDEV